MKTRIRRLWLLAIMMCVSIGARAHDFVVNGIYYSISTSTEPTVRVTYRGDDYDSYSNEYTGSVTIPESVTYSGKTYSVTSIGYDAFYKCSGLTSITIGNSVTSIGSSAFSGCSGLTSIEIPNSVTSIGSYTFYGCTGLTSVVFNAKNCTSCGSSSIPAFPSTLTTLTIGNEVETIPDYAFSGCTGLTSIVIPNSVKSIGKEAFRNCSGLTSVVFNAKKCTSCGSDSYPAFPSTITNLTIGNEVEAIPDYAFSGCSGLTSIEIPNSVTSIGSYAFWGCTGLTSIVIPNSVTSIGGSAFSGCSGLTSIEIPNSVTSIGNYAFRGCSGLTSVTIGNSVTEIGYEAFSGCSGLTSIEIPNSVTSIGGSAFVGCTGLTKATFASIKSLCRITFSDYSSNPLYHAKHLYIGDEEVTEVVIPEDVKSIGNYTFYNCPGLTSVEIGNSVTSIGGSAFSGCSGLTSIEIPNSVTSIGDQAFYKCSGLTSVVIPNSVTKIGGSAFCDCSGLTSVTIGNSVTSIGDYAFRGCSGLTSVTINSNAIASEAYGTSSNISEYFGTQVTSYTFGGGVETIGTNACYGLKELKNVSIGEGVTSIGNDAFKECTGLIRTDYASIESLLGIQFGNSYANPLYYTKALNVGGKIVTELEIPESVAAINSFAFYNCNSIKKVTGGKNVTSIGKSAFYNNVKLTSVQIGGKVEEIGDYAFNKCPLTTIYNYAEYPQNCGSNTFSIAKENCKLYVLPESVDMYSVHQDWYEFNINAMDAETVGVEAIDNGQLTMNNAKGVYDLSGRKMNVNVNVNDNINVNNSKLKKGLYIVNGKKLLKR